MERLNVQVQRPQRGEHLGTGVALGGQQVMGLALTEPIKNGHAVASNGRLRVTHPVERFQARLQQQKARVVLNFVLGSQPFPPCFRLSG